MERRNCKEKKDSMTTIVTATRTYMLSIVNTRVTLATHPYRETITMQTLQIIKEDCRIIARYTGDEMLPYCIGFVTIFCVGLVQKYKMVKYEMQYGNLLFRLFVT